MPVAGGEPVVLTTPNTDGGELDHRWPEVLPGGRAVLFEVAMSSGPEDSRIAVHTLDDGATRYLLTGGTNPRYVPTGHIVYGFDGTLRAVGFDLERLQVTTEPVPVVDGVAFGLRGSVHFSISNDGSLVYVTGGYRTEVGGYSLVWVDRDGRKEPLDLEIDLYSSHRLSPDGTRVLYNKREGQNRGDIQVYEIARNRSQPLTFTGNNGPAIWMPDGERVVFQSARDGGVNLYWKVADGTSEVEQLTESPESHVPWWTDGQALVFRSGGGAHSLSLDSERMLGSVLQMSGRLDVSPDGKWLAYESIEDGGIHVTSFPDVGRGGRWRVAGEDARVPVWSPDGQELFYYNGRALMSLPVSTEPSFAYGDPEVVFEGLFTITNGGAGFSVSPDGQRFLMVRSVDSRINDGINPEVVLVQNWFEELKRLVPTDGSR